MSLVDALKQSGFKPEKSTDGEFQPLEGIYKTQFVKAEVKEANEKGGKQLQVEFKIAEVLSGKESTSKYNEFRKYLALEGDDAISKKKGLPWIINALFTAGVEVSGDTDEVLMQNIQNALGTEVYVKAWGWKPEDGDKSFQQFSVLKEAIAIKQAKSKQKESGVGF